MEAQKERRRRNNDLCRRVVIFIMTCDSKTLAKMKVEALADQFAVNRTYLSNKFHKEMHHTLEEQILRVRMGRALTLLETAPRLSVTRIARILGFCRCDHFIKTFRRYYGITPGEYRKIQRASLDTEAD